MGLNTFLHNLVTRMGGDSDLHAQIDDAVPADKDEVKATDSGEEETTSAS
jgi:hypothetical protein